MSDIEPPDMTRPTCRIGNALAAWVRLVLRLRKTTIPIWIALAGFGVHKAVSDLGTNTDSADMISPQLPWRQDFTTYRESFPSRDRNLIVVIDAASVSRTDASEGEPDRRVSLGSLAFSSHVRMAGMGRLLMLGMAVSLAATLLVPPALYKLEANR